MILDLILIETQVKRPNYCYVGREMDTGAQIVESSDDQKSLFHSVDCMSLTATDSFSAKFIMKRTSIIYVTSVRQLQHITFASKLILKH